MPLSMTGCGDGTATEGRSACRAEVRSVNNRFLKVSLRAREGFSLLESRVEALVRRHVRRGAVQVTLEVTGPAAPAGRSLDAAQLDTYLGQLESLCAARNLPPPKSLDGLLGLPGILVESVPSAETVEAAWPLVERALSAALEGHDRMRRTEGEALARDMRAACQSIREVAAGIRLRVPNVVAEQRERLKERVGRILEQQGLALAEGDVARDIAEELVRLESHVAQFERLLGEDAPGRSLDFLAQELTREANTIASKSLDVETAHAVVELKTPIEQLREQVQNVE